MIYLDNSATTPIAPEVLERMSVLRREVFGNASSIHRIGQRARAALDESREKLAMMIEAEPREIIFTSGGTESDNTAIKGYAFARHAESGRWPAIITARTEHHAVLAPIEMLATMGADVHYLQIESDGRVSCESLRSTLESLDGSVVPLVSIMHANNETGVVNPIADLALVAHESGAVMHSDTVQSFGKIPVSARALGIDMMSFSAHKIHGPRGIGALYLRKEIEIEPLMHGGVQERNRRGGTEPVELVVGFDVAARISITDLNANAERMADLRDRLRSGIIANVEGSRVITTDANSLPNILSVTFDDAIDLDGEALIVGMDLRDVAVSNGSACTSGSPQPSHVLLAMGLPAEQARAAVRFSISRYTTAFEIDSAVAALAEVLATMRRN